MAQGQVSSLETDVNWYEISCMPSCYVNSEKAIAWEDRYPPEFGTDIFKAAFTIGITCCCLPVNICQALFICICISSLFNEYRSRHFVACRKSPVARSIFDFLTGFQGKEHALHQLTPWRRVLSEKLTGPGLVKKFLQFQRILMFITALKKARHVSHPTLEKPL